jgi:mRNA interferase MazF
MKRGEVRWYKFSHPDKRRPVVILTRDSIIEHLGAVTIALVTSTIRDIPSEVNLGLENGMPRACAINCDHLQTVPKAKIGSLIATLDPERLSQVRKAIQFALNL